MAGEVNTEPITRFEVIDHRRKAEPFGRVLVEYGVSIELAVQDAGRTLKVFINDRKER